MKTANFRIEHAGTFEVVIRDIGPWDEHPTVTNDAEGVVARLIKAGDLQRGQRLFYYDSEGRFDEIIFRDGRFVTFRPGPSENSGGRNPWRGAGPRP